MLLSTKAFALCDRGKLSNVARQADTGPRNNNRPGKQMITMRLYTREVDGESTWAPVAIVMTVLVVVMLLGYFFWYGPAQTGAAQPATVTVNTPASPQSSPTTVVVPSPGPAGANGATGATGASGPAGAAGATGTSGTDGADGATGTRGEPGPSGKPGDGDAGNTTNEGK
jgi:hypothetical protein